MLVRKIVDENQIKLELERETLQKQLNEYKEKLSLTSEEATIELKEHMAQIHQYNEIKDLGQRLLGILAEKTGVTVKSLYDDLDLPLTED